MSAELELLAERRHRCWVKLSDPTLLPMEKHDLALRTRRLTTLLNGHDQDCHRDVLITPHFQKPLDGLWAMKRRAQAK